MKERKRVYIDMDGVLAEYRTDATEEDYVSEGYYLGLAPRRGMVDAVRCLIDSDTADVFVLSSVIAGIESTAVAEKNAWLDRYLPQIDRSHRVFPLCGTSKADAVGGIDKDDVLCDDYSHNLENWQKAGGTAVKILNECNGRHGSFRGGPRVRISGGEQLVELINYLS